MPKIEVVSKFTKNDVVFFIYQNGIMKGVIHNLTIHNPWGIENDPRCEHQKAEDRWGEIGDLPYDVTKPIIEYTIKLEHPLAEELNVNKLGQVVPMYERVVGSGRLFRSPATLINFLNRKFKEAYGYEAMAPNPED